MDFFVFGTRLQALSQGWLWIAETGMLLRH